MSVATASKPATKHAWNTSLYTRIVEASVRGDELRILFANRTWTTALLDDLLPGKRARANWERMTYSPHEIIVPTEDGAIEISAFSIRALTDPEFAAHLHAVEKRTAVRRGRQIREWRQERGLSIDDLALATGLPAATLDQIEQGSVDHWNVRLGPILAPLGRTLKDLALSARDSAEDEDEEMP